MNYICPSCGGDEFEERGDIRRYIPVVVVEEADGTPKFIDDPERPWVNGDDFDPDEIPYSCVRCDSEFENASDLIDLPECDDCATNGPDCRTHGDAYRLAHLAIQTNPAAAESALQGVIR